MKPDEPIAQKNIISRGLPKTGQTISYRDWDDGDFEDGWWIGRLNANNRTRFIEKTLSGDDVVFDRATGLMWPKSGLSAGCAYGATRQWIGALLSAFELNFAGFTDWKLPNLQELLSIGNMGLAAPAIWPPFTNTQAPDYYGYWTSTTRADLTANAWYVRFYHAYGYNAPKTNTKYMRSTRRFRRC